MKTLHKLASLTALLALFTFGAMAQTASLEGEVKGEDGKPLKDAWVKIARKDLKGAEAKSVNRNQVQVTAPAGQSVSPRVVARFDGPINAPVAKGTRLGIANFPPGAAAPRRIDDFFQRGESDDADHALLVVFHANQRAEQWHSVHK